MKVGSIVLAVSLLSASFAQSAHSSTVLNTCSNSTGTGECRAALVTVYSVGNQGYAVLANHLLPSVCTGAPWGYYWSLDLTDTVARARFAMLLSAFLSGQPVELRALSAYSA